jgi:hypothetical protein
MNYVTALRQATSRIQTVGADDETEAQACLRLACLAFDSPNPPDRAWALLGLDLLTVQADLYPDPAPVAVTVARPPATDAPIRTALADLVRALADSYQHASAQPEPAIRRRFAYAAAASRLHSVAQGLA